MKYIKHFWFAVLIVLISCETPVVTLPPQDNGPGIESITASAPDENSIVKLTFLFKEDVHDFKYEDIHFYANFLLIIDQKSFGRPDEDNYRKYELGIIPGGSGLIRVALSPYSFTGWSVEVVEVYANYYFTASFNTVDNNYDIIINKYNDTNTDIIIPEKIGGYPVRRISGNAFNEIELTGIVIPNGVRIIEQAAFSNNKLVNITIPESITTINPHTFSKNQLTDLFIPENITVIGLSAFGSNQLTCVSFSEGVTSLSGFDNNKLLSVNIPSTVKNIGNYAFENNYLAEIIFSDDGELTHIGNYAFSCNQLKEVDIPESVTSIADYAFAFNFLTKVTLRENITHLGGFNNNQMIELNIPDSVTNIGDYAFANNEIVEIEIPQNTTSIGLFAFANNKISVLTFKDEIKLTSIDEGAFQNNNLTSITIPGNITIAKQAFTGNQFTNIVIGENVTLNGIVFGNGFENVYNKNKEAGTYKRESVDSNIWYLE